MLAAAPAFGRGERLPIKTYTTADGLAHNTVNRVVRDSRGFLWFCTDEGLSLFDGYGFINFGLEQGLPNLRVRDLLETRGGEYWVATGAGLVRFNPKGEPGRRSSAPARPGEADSGPMFTVFYSGEGDLTRSVLTLLQDRSGNIWAETQGGLFRLEGADADWGPPTEQRTVNYATLAPGRYRFLVRAVNSGGDVSPVPAAVTFTIRRQVWRRWWFLMLIALGCAAAVYALHRHRVARVLEVAHMRTRIATDLHDDIGANLTKIAILSEVARRQAGGNGGGDGGGGIRGGGLVADTGLGSGGPLDAIARISRESVAAMSDIVWAVNPERDTLLDLVRRMRQHAEDTFAPRDIGLTFRAPTQAYNQKLGVDVRRDLFLIFKEATNNAARHSGCTRVAVDFCGEGRRLSLRVADDGAGFDPTVESEGQGLASMRRLARALGGSLEVESRSGQGTAIHLRVFTARGV